MTSLNMIALILARNKLNLEANHLGTCYETKPVVTLIFYFNSFDQLFIIIELEHFKNVVVAPYIS